MTAVPFGSFFGLGGEGGVAIGQVVDGQEGLEVIDSTFLPGESFHTQAQQPVLWPILISQPSIFIGASANITVEDVPTGTFGTSTDDNFNYMYYRDDVPGSDAIILVYRAGFSNPTGVVLSRSTDGGVTWAHSAVVDYLGGTDISKTPYRWTVGNQPKTMFTSVSTLCQNMTIQQGLLVAGIDNQLNAGLVILNFADGTVNDEPMSGVVESTPPVSIHHINGLYVATIALGASPTNLAIYTKADDNFTGAWTKLFTTPEGESQALITDGETSSEIQFIDGVYYWAVQQINGSNRYITIRRSTDLTAWTVIGSTATSVTPKNYGFCRIVKLLDGTLVLLYELAGDLEGQRFDQNGLVGDPKLLDSNNPPRQGFIDPISNAYLFDNDSAFGNTYLDLNNSWALLTQLVNINATSSTFIGDEPWRDRHETEAYMFALSRTVTTGSNNLILRIHDIPASEQRSVANLVSGTTNAKAFLKGE